MLPVLPDRPFQAVILPADIAKTSSLLAKRFTDFWTPTVEQITLAEKRISDYLATAATNNKLSPTQQKLGIIVRDKPAGFIRQYIGGIRGGRRVIYCVGNEIGFARGDRWRRELIFWFDAASTWQITYDVQDDICRNFHFDEGF